MDNFNEKKDNAVTLAAPPYGLWLVAVPNARTHAAQLPITSVIQILFFEHRLSVVQFSLRGDSPPQKKMCGALTWTCYMFATKAPQDTMGFTYSWIEIPQNWAMGTVGDCDDIDDKRPHGIVCGLLTLKPW